MQSRLAPCVKALVNEDTLLWTHCCPRCFLCCTNCETFAVDTKCFGTKSETFCVPDTICVHNKCCTHWQMGKHLCRQQCVRNTVSSFARALSGNSVNIPRGHKFNLRTGLPCLLWKKKPSLSALMQKSYKGDYVESSTFTLNVPRLFTAFKNLFTQTWFSLRA